MSRRVVVTGLGLISPLGDSPEKLWQALSSGQSGIRPLQAIPAELYEAAEIDGASRFQALRHVTIPSLAGVIATALLLRTIWVANSLDVILVMTGGGPGYTTYTVPLYAFLKAYTSMEFGYAAALSLIMTALLLLVIYAYVRRQAKAL